MPALRGAVADVTLGAVARRGWRHGCRPPACARSAPIVDITNYVNLEIGQPMHAFDLAKLAGAEIRVRRARPGETITTLDGVERTLDPDMLVIADRDRAQAVAGVMGGAASEVSAVDDARSCSRARTSSRHRCAAPASGSDLKTEASSRFERGADIGAPVVALAARRRADGADRRGTRRRADRRRLSAAARARSAFTCGATGWRAARRRACPTPTSSGFCARSASTVIAAADGWDVDRADVPRRSAARSRPHRGSRPPLRLRQARGRRSRR